jgi:L-fuculose-phosphate aldolase
MSWNDVRQAIVDACKRLEAENLVHGSSGNVSVRLPKTDDGRDLFAMTPSGVPYRVLRPEQVLIVDAEANVVDGDGVGKPSSERKVHFAAYAARPDVGAVIHSHSVYAGALAAAGQDLPPVIDEMVVAIGGAVQCAPYGMPATPQLADSAIGLMGLRQAVLLRNHGVVGVGRDLDEALAVVGMVERTAQIYLLARLIGDVQPIPDHVAQIEVKFFRIQHGLPQDD